VHDFFVPVEAKPLETFEDRARALVGAARLVGVLDAKQELAAKVPGVKPIEESGPGAADVEIAGRRRGETKAGLGDG
jgi:hypothetical protein